MKRKSLSVLKYKNNLLNEKKILNNYLKFKQKIYKFKKNTSYTVAVSGGPDSMALLGLSNIMMTEERYKFHFAMVDHRIRRNSSNESKKLKEILKKKGIKLEILKNQKKITKNIQKNARDVRYNLLTKFCKKVKSKYLITAHHQDDQIETFFIRLSRGSGVEGLSSMNEKTKINRGITLIRPFLNTKKKELSQIAKKIFGKTFTDPSNKNQKFLRTNMRNLKKILEEKGLNLESISNSIRNISKTKDAINFYVLKAMKKLVKFKKHETILNLINFNKQPDEIKFRIINNIVKKRTNSYYPPRSYKVINLINRFEANNLKKCTLGGCLFEKKRNYIHVSRENRRI